MSMGELVPAHASTALSRMQSVTHGNATDDVIHAAKSNENARFLAWGQSYGRQTALDFDARGATKIGETDENEKEGSTGRRQPSYSIRKLPQISEKWCAVSRADFLIREAEETILTR